jgi:hypothetical protein
MPLLFAPPFVRHKRDKKLPMITIREMIKHVGGSPFLGTPRLMGYLLPPHISAFVPFKSGGS